MSEYRDLNVPAANNPRVIDDRTENIAATNTPVSFIANNKTGYQIIAGTAGKSARRPNNLGKSLQRKVAMRKIFCLALTVVLIVSGASVYKSRAQEPDTISAITAGPKILVLNYHQVDNKHTSLAVPLSDFEAQMKFLVDSGCVTITPDELYAGLRGELELPPRPVLITFDDGYLDNYTNAFPILKKYGLHATIFIIPAFTGQYPGYMTWDQLREMEANGITIESHTLTHPKLEELPDDEIRAELLNSKNLLEENLGHPIEFLAYPTGTYNLHIAGIAQDLGYKGAFTIKYGIVDRGSNFFALERVPVFHTQTTMKDFYERIAWRQSFEEFGWIKR